jgi:multiple sugar transport system substrate-binding protein
MKRLLTIITVLVLTATLVACGGSGGGGGETQQIELTYADWANQELNQQLIDAFMEANPEIRVILRTDITGSGDAFTGNLVTAAQAGLLPDVFATDNVPTVVNAGLTLDVAQYWDQDADSQLVYDNIAATGVYDGKRFALPSFQFLKGIMINLDIFEDANLTTVEGEYRIDNDGYPVKDWTFEEFVNIASAIKDFDPNDYQSGYVLGLDTWYGTPDFQQVWPMMDDAAVGYDTFDGEQFNYSTSDSWKDALTAKIEMHALTDGTTTRFDAEFLEANSDLAIYHIQNGTAAMDIEGSWQFWVLNDAKENGINLGFWPYPQGSAGFFPPTILDYLAVSSETEFPEEAFKLAKWMSFGKAGYSARLDILEANNAIAEANGDYPTYLDRFPIADYPDVWDRVDGFVSDIEGIDYILDNIENAKPDLDKWLPGYKDFWSWVFDPENPYNFDALVVAGASSVPTWATEWERKINEIVQTALETLGQPPVEE